MKNKNHQQKADQVLRQAGRERYQSRSDMADRAWRAAQQPRGQVRSLGFGLWKAAAVLALLLLNGFVAVSYLQAGDSPSASEVLATDYNLRSGDVSDYLISTSQ